MPLIALFLEHLFLVSATEYVYTCIICASLVCRRAYTRPHSPVGRLILSCNLLIPYYKIYTPICTPAFMSSPR